MRIFFFLQEKEALNEFNKSTHRGLITNPYQFVLFSQLDVHEGCAAFLFLGYSLRHLFLDELFKAGLPASFFFLN